MQYLGDKITVIDEQVRKGRNKVRSWTYGYHEAIDTVIISKDGTLGDVYNVCGINIGLPEKPPHKEIINWDKTQANQIWKREELPEGLDKKSWKQARFKEYIADQFTKRDQGVWIYLNGIPVYLTGTYWFFIQWTAIEEGYPALRIIQNELMIFWEACKADKRCFGMVYVKNRRIGASSMAVAELLETGTIYDEKKLGIISKTGEDASEIFDRVVTAFNKLPQFFRPKTEGTSRPKKVLSFNEEAKKGRGKEDEEEDDENSNTSIKWYPTAKNSMDGRKMFRTLIDEAGKWETVSFDRYWPVVKTSHKKGRVIAGKAMVVSTVNHMDSGGREYKNIWDGSDALERDGNDQTRSGLYRIFIPAKYCLEGFFDKYGFSIVDDPKEPVLADDGEYVKIGASTYLKNTREALKADPEDYNEEVRQFPNTSKEAFRESSNDCDFNLNHLLEQIEHNENELGDRWSTTTKESASGSVFLGNDEVERGNFHWKDGIQDTEVIWKPDNERGRFYIAKKCHPSDEYRNKKEKKTIHGVLAWAPCNEHIGCGGVDPYNRSKTVDGRGSKGSIHISTKYNTGPFPNNAYILEYIDRPLKVEHFYEDVIMAHVYFGMPFLAELSSEKFSQYILDRGYRHFSKNNPFKRWDELGPAEQEYGGVPAQDAKTGEQQFYAVEAYIEDHIGVARSETHRPIGNMGYMPFTRTLMQWKDVDTTKRTKYDAYISSSLSLLGNQSRIKKEAPPPPKAISIPYARFNNKEGLVSQRI